MNKLNDFLEWWFDTNSFSGAGRCFLSIMMFYFLFWLACR